MSGGGSSRRSPSSTGTGPSCRNESLRWWASRWFTALETLGLVDQIERGRRYMRAGRVLKLELEPAHLMALVQGSRYEPYRVRIRVKSFTERQWERVFEGLASQARFEAKLLSGEIPSTLEDVLLRAGLSLFPSSCRDIKATCSCASSDARCKHVTAVFLVLAEHIDQDPFLLFLLRGADRGQILRAIRDRRAAEASGRTVRRRKVTPLSGSLDRFWKVGQGMDSMKISVGPPAVSASLLKRLGVPTFWKAHPEIRGALERLYAKVTERSMALAYGGKGLKSHGRSSDRERFTE